MPPGIAGLKVRLGLRRLPTGSAPWAMRQHGAGQPLQPETLHRAKPPSGQWLDSARESFPVRREGASVAVGRRCLLADLVNA
jgi:hypothetical protein